VTELLSAVLDHPIHEIAILAGLFCVSVVAVGFSVELIFRGLSLLVKTMHIKKIGVTGIECSEPTRRGK
jgi:hypothetical protein